MSALTATWPCPHCDTVISLPVKVTSTDTIRDEDGKVTGVILTPDVDTSEALTHLTDKHLVADQ
jgi:hypothetical protein